MVESKTASKETIANLIVNSGLAIDELYKVLNVELVVRSLMDVRTPQLYILTQDLQNGIKFILMDMSVSCRAEFAVDNICEKRFYLKNIQASISEGYKLIYNFGKLRSRSLWKKLMMKVCKDGSQELIDECMEIDKNLETFGKTEIDKELRDLTLHYDDEMIKVYQKTLSVNNEDKVMKIVVRFWGILQDIVLFTQKVDAYCLEATNIEKIYPAFQITPKVNPFHQTVCNLINKESKLEDVLKNIIQRGAEGLDCLAKYWFSTKRIEKHIQENASTIGHIQEIDNIQALTNVYLLLQFMMLDLAAIVDAYLKSSSNIEYALNLRRVCVIKVSTMVHLYGYTSDEHNCSIWVKIEKMIPKDSRDLKDTANGISRILNEIVTNNNDKELRSTFVHLFDNSRACADITKVVMTIESINPMEQIVETQLLLEVHRRLMNFITNLMNVLSQNAHEKNLESTKSINDQLNESIHKIENSQLPDEQKKHVIAMISKIKKIINGQLYNEDK